MEFSVLGATDVEEILAFEHQKLALTGKDRELAMIESWTAAWRKESLEHYLPLGWSFVCRNQQKISAYFLAQPLLFFDGMTQSLWIEHLSFGQVDEGAALVELAYRMAREKHLQRLILPRIRELENANSLLQGKNWQNERIIIATTRIHAI